MGYTALGNNDIRAFNLSVKEGLLDNKLQYIHKKKDATGLEGPPELAIYPLKKRHMTDIQPPADKNLFNYQHVRSITRTGNELEKFMNQHAELVGSKWYYRYKV